MPNNLLSGFLCPNCNFSKGENKINSWLKEHNIPNIPQKTFKDCINPRTNAKLRFDFYFPSINTCREFDGKAHTQPIDFGNKGGKWAKEQLNNTMYRDNIKNEYCKNNGISLIRIPYTEFDNIENILNNLFRKE